MAATLAHADPWISPGDAALRHHIEVLADAGVIHVPVTTWPLMWSGIAADLDAAHPDTLDAMTRQSLDYVRQAWQRQDRAGVKAEARLEAGRGPQAVGGFADTRREQDEASAAVADQGEHWAARLQATVAEDPIDQKTYRPDGSYVAGMAGNWVLAAGWQDRWWGPGWQTSLIESDNARPIPALSLQRNRSDASSLPLLRWLGPWQFTSFIGRLDGADRFVDPAGVPASSDGVANADLVGGRLSFKPADSLEIGIGRLFEFGGDGRPGSPDMLLRNLAGSSSGDDHGVLEGGYDLRWNFLNAGSTRNSLYGQMIGQNATGEPPLPSRFMYLAGVESAFAAGGLQHRLALEAAQTDGNGFGADDRIFYNYSYENPIYHEGLRYEGRPLAASLDNDGRSLTLRGDHFWVAQQYQLSWQLAWLNINMDGGNVPPPGGNVYGGHTETPRAELSWAFPLWSRLRLELGAQYYRRPLSLDGQTVGSGPFAKLTLPL